MASGLRKRKTDHIELCGTEKVAFRQKTTLLDNVQLIHQSLPEASLDELDLDVQLLGKRLRAPIIIAAITGGTRAGGKINSDLAQIAEKHGYGFGLGSQRPMLQEPSTAASYKVRTRAPTALILGNIGVVQAREYPSQTLGAMAEQVGADALCVHMSPAMELVQPGGDRDFRGCAETFARLVRDLALPVVAKETGSGLGRRSVETLRKAGVTVVDVSGAGGTSWVGVETLRARDSAARRVGELLWDWGVPTAVSVINAVAGGMTAIATGGIRNGLDAARALALGATAVGIARPVLQAYQKGGKKGAEAYLLQVERELSAVMILCGARTIADLQQTERVLTGELREWLSGDDR
jgi:isopentenyl-diphosphate delta-isomerase